MDSVCLIDGGNRNDNPVASIRSGVVDIVANLHPACSVGIIDFEIDRKPECGTGSRIARQQLYIIDALKPGPPESDRLADRRRRMGIAAPDGRAVAIIGCRDRP
ncbi:hypothetical protein FQZ97_1008910 [compost metagenome]